ncbi:MAG TPA: 2OG-Fe(II) oxygenase [Kiloniellaceae bacterium]|nr:2OG-Fe(II) oxygenase [Kiloniellaceae bacterium]
MILSLWDNLVRDPGLMEALKAVQDDYGLIDSSTSHWYPRQAGAPGQPRNPIERLAEIVVATVCPEGLVGVEYWTNSLGSGEIMYPHKDKDEKLYLSRKEFRHPAVSTVFYPGHLPFAGGQLVIDRRHMLSPAPNQLAAFRGDLEHGVQKVTDGTRHSIALNLWDVTPIAYQG